MENKEKQRQMKYFYSFLNERTENLEGLSYYQGFFTRLEMNIMFYVCLFNCLQINIPTNMPTNKHDVSIKKIRMKKKKHEGE